MSSIKIELRQEDVTKIKEICASFDNDPQELINVLHKCQEHFGYLPAEVQEVISNELVVPVAKIYGVVTFYSFFTMTPKGKHPVSICMGTACYVRGAEKVLDEFKKELGLQAGQTTGDGKFSLSSLRCIGACGLAPVVMVGDKTYGRVAPDDVRNIIKEYKQNNPGLVFSK
ncbi:MAG: NADH-quinone oxidoreductase subunit NuoE [Bacteroidales bacterium]|nr:NADH-quinone oxidoreductase subunit NuoE [Bacteroidales bacterium]